ncbi:MAG: type II toxin-antitoxin system Phd/YefM family antitoxin [Polyangiaceae bacterium]
MEGEKPSEVAVAEALAEMYKVYMQLPISDARRRLPELVQKARRGEVIEVTVRGEVVARIVAPEAAADDAARRLLAAMRKMGQRPSGRRPRDVSSRKTEHLTGRVR